VHHDVGDVAMHEEFSGQEIDDFVGGYSAIRATDPKVGRRLLLGKTRKKIRILALDIFRPCFVFGKEMIEMRHRHALGAGNSVFPIRASRQTELNSPPPNLVCDHRLALGRRRWSRRGSPCAPSPRPRRPPALSDVFAPLGLILLKLKFLRRLCPLVRGDTSAYFLF